MKTFKVVVFVSPKCEDCMWTTKLLETYVPNAVPMNEFREVELDVNSKLDEEIISYLTEITGCYTVRYEDPDNLEVCRKHIVVECFKAVSYAIDYNYILTKNYGICRRKLRPKNINTTLD